MTPQKLRDLLDKSIMDIKTELNLHVHDPEHSFLRNRKLPFEKVISTLLAMEGRTINNELLYLLLFNNEIRLNPTHLKYYFVNLHQLQLQIKTYCIKDTGCWPLMGLTFK